MDPDRRALWQPLLFRQICLLAAFAGMVAQRKPEAGCAAGLLLAGWALSRPLADRTNPEGSTSTWAKALFLVLSFVLGLGYAGWRTKPPLPSIPDWVAQAVTPRGPDSPAAFRHGLRFQGRIIRNEPLAGGRFRLTLEDVRAAGQDILLPGKLVLTWSEPPPDVAGAGPGQDLALTARLREIRGFANPGTWDTEAYWRDRGVYFRAWARGDAQRQDQEPYALSGTAHRGWAWRDALRSRVVGVLATQGQDGAGPLMPRHAAIIPALLFGDRSFCRPDDLDLVARATLAHSLALSGMHLGFAVGLGYALAAGIALFRPSILLRVPLPKLGLLLGLPLCAAYIWLGAAPPSLVRAGLMVLFWTGLLWLNRPKVLMDGLLWAVAVILAIDPASLWDIRLQLSAVSVAGISLALPLLSRWTTQVDRIFTNRSAWLVLLRRPLKGIVGLAVISVAAQAAVLPIVLHAFPGTGCWLPLNVLWLPVLGMWVMPLAFAGLAAAALNVTTAAGALFSLASLPCQALYALLERMDAAGILISPVFLSPDWQACAGYWLLILLIPVALSGAERQIRTKVFLGIALLLAVWPSLATGWDHRRERVEMVLLDVGQGQAVLVSWQGLSGRGRVLIDGGGFVSPTFDLGRRVLTPILTANSPPKLSWIINSHPDADHLQGLLFPMKTFAVDHVGLGPDPPGKRTTTMSRRDAILSSGNISVEGLAAGRVIALAPALRLEVLHPGDARGLSANDSALVLRLVWKDRPLALICGDVEKKGIAHLLRTGPDLSAQVLILPHHGSAGSLSPALYEAVTPDVAAAACGYANNWHFPATAVRDALAARGIPLSTTASKGQIRFSWTADGSRTVTYARPPDQWRGN